MNKTRRPTIPNRLLFVLASVTISSLATAADNCDCTIYPFRPDPPCAARCSAKLLEGSDYGSMVQVLGLRPDVAKRVSAFSSERKPVNLYEYAQVLPKQDYDALDARLRSLSQDEFRKLKKTDEPTKSTPDKAKP